MRLYGAIDLHANTNVLAVIDETGKTIVTRKLQNDSQLIVNFINPYKKDITGIAVESTYNWYWLVDALMDEGYRVHLANPSAMRKYSGLKHSTDIHDALWLADLLRLGILPQGYVYPKETRPLRDLLRKRAHLVKLRASLVISLQNIVVRNFGLRLKNNTLQYHKENRVRPFLGDNEDIVLAGMATKEAIDFLTGQIKKIESVINTKSRLLPAYHNLLTIPGVGRILGITIMFETGPIERFAKVGNYVSYCRKVASKWVSNEKTKGKGNTRNGNKYLSWAFSEAASHARRHHDASQAFYNRKLKKNNVAVAHGALAHKLARAAYYIMRDNVPFDEAKLYG
jgi:transposase